MRKMNEKGGAVAVTLAVIGIILLVVIVIPLIGAGLGIINLPFLRLGKQVELNQGVIKKSLDTDYCLNNYEWFKDTYQDIQQTEVKVQNLEQQLADFQKDAGPRESWTFEDKQFYNNTRAELTGTKNYKAEIVGQYNSRAQQLNRTACKELPLFVKP